MTHDMVPFAVAFTVVFASLIGIAVGATIGYFCGGLAAEKSAVRSANAGRPHTFGMEEYRLVFESKYVVMEARERAYLDALAHRQEEVVRDVARSAGPLAAGQVASDLQHVDNDSVAGMPPLSDFVDYDRIQTIQREIDARGIEGIPGAKAPDLHDSPSPPDEEELQYGTMRGDLSHNSTVVPMRIGDIPTSPRKGPLMVRVRLPKDPTGESMLHSGGEFSVEVVGEGVELPVKSVTIERTGVEDLAVVKLEMFHFDLDAELLPIVERLDVRCMDSRCGIRFGVIERLDFDRIEWSACEMRGDGSFREVPGKGSATMLAFGGLEWGKVSVGDVVPLFWRGAECLYAPPVMRARPDEVDPVVEVPHCRRCERCGSLVSWHGGKGWISRDGTDGSSGLICPGCSSHSPAPGPRVDGDEVEDEDEDVVEEAFVENALPEGGILWREIVRDDDGIPRAGERWGLALYPEKTTDYGPASFEIVRLRDRPDGELTWSCTGEKLDVRPDAEPKSG